MATYFVDSSAAGGGTGTDTSPFNSITGQLLPVLASGDYVFLAGDFREGQISKSSVSNVQFRQWRFKPDHNPQVQCRIFGDTLLPNSGWTSGANSSYSKVISAPGAGGVVDMTWGWDASVDTAGRHYGHLKLDTKANVQAGTAGTFFFESGTNTLYICLGSGVDPNNGANGVLSYVIGQRSGLVFSSCSNILVGGIKVALFSDGSPGYGYGVLFTDSTSCTAYECVTTDCGYHGIGATGVCTGHRYINCRVWGGNSSGSGTGSGYVFYSSSGNNVTNCEAWNCVAVPYTHLGISVVNGLAQVINTSWRYDGFYTHSATANGVQSVRFIGCHVKHHGTTVADCNGYNAFGCDNTARPGTVADRDDYTKYAVQCISCRVSRGWHMQTVTSIAFVRCDFHFERIGPLAAVDTGGKIGDLGSGTALTLLFDDCQIVADLVGTSDNLGILFQVGTNCQIIQLECSVYALPTTNLNKYEVIFNWSGAATIGVRARGCIYCMGNTSTNHMLNIGNPANAALLDFRNCAYRGFGGSVPPFYSTTGGFQNWAQWSASVDTTGVELAAHPFVRTDGVNLEPTAAVIAVKSSGTPNGAVGFNGHAYDGTRGCYQYGARSLSSSPIAPTRAEVLATGRDLHLVWDTSLTPFQGPVEQYQAWLEGSKFTLSSGGNLVYGGTDVEITPTTMKWTTKLLIPSASRVVWGQTGITLSAPAGALDDGCGNTSAAITAMAVTNLSLMDATGFPADITPPAGSYRLYVDEEVGSDARTLAQAKVPSTPLASFNQAQALIIADGKQFAGCQIYHIGGTTKYRVTADPYDVIKCGGPDPQHPFVWGVCNPDGSLPAFSRRELQVDSQGVTDAYLRGATREGGDGGPSTCDNVLVYGHALRAINGLYTAQGSALTVTRASNHWCVCDCVFEGFAGGINLQPTGHHHTLYRNTFMHIIRVPSGGHPIAVYAERVSEALMVAENVFWDCGKRSADGSRGDALSRPIYCTDYFDSSTAAGSSGFRHNWFLHAFGIAMQNRTGGSILGNHFEAVDSACYLPSGLIRGATVTLLRDLVDETGGVIPKCEGPFINSVATESPEAGGMAAKICEIAVYPEAGSASYRGIGPSCKGGNIAGGQRFELSNASVASVGPFWVNPPRDCVPAMITVTRNIIHGGGYQSYCVYAEEAYNTYTDWLFSDGNVMVAGTGSKFGQIHAVDKDVSYWRGLLEDVNSVLAPTPAWADTTRTVTTWIADSGAPTPRSGSGAPAYSILANRGYRTWNPWDSEEDAQLYFQAGLQATNYAAFGPNPRDKYGTPVGFYELQSAGGGGSGSTGLSALRVGLALSLTS